MGRDKRERHRMFLHRMGKSLVCGASRKGGYGHIRRAMMSNARYTVGQPTSALAKPNSCVFGDNWTKVPLESRQSVSHDTRLLTFALDDPNKPMGLSTCACVLVRGGRDAEGNAVVRPYSPVSTNKMHGKFEVIVKVYDQGVMSKHMDGMKVGDTLDFKHIDKNVKIQYPFGKKRIGMLVGGTGITPMIQALHALLGTKGDTTDVSLLFGNRSEKDILLRETLDEWATQFSDRFHVTHVLSDEDSKSSWKGPRGFINKALIEKHCPPPSPDTLLFVCGPPPMYNALCGPRDDANITGLLKELGYDSSHIFKF